MLERIDNVLPTVARVVCWFGVALGVLTKDYAYSAFMMAWLIYLKD